MSNYLSRLNYENTNAEEDANAIPKLPDINTQNENIPLLNSLRQNYGKIQQSSPEVVSNNTPVNSLIPLTEGVSQPSITTPITTQPESSSYPNISKLDTINPTTTTTPGIDTPKDTIGGMPVNAFAQLMGITANALDPKGFGGRLGEGVAKYAATQQAQEPVNALRKMQALHLDMQNKELAAKLDPNSQVNALKRIQLKHAEQQVADESRKASKDLISKIDIETLAAPDNYVATVNQLKQSGADTSLLPDVKVFQTEDGLFNKDLFGKWRLNYITSADKKAEMSHQDQKDRLQTTKIYNEANGTSMEVTYDKKKIPVFDPVKTYGPGWSVTVPKTTQVRNPTPFSVAYTAGKAAGKSDEQIVTEFKAKEKTEQTGTWSYIGDNDAGVPMVMNNKTSAIKPMPLPVGMEGITKRGGTDLTPKQVAGIETLINGVTDKGVAFGTTPAAQPQIDLYNVNDTKGYVYKMTPEVKNTWSPNIPGKLEKVPLPVVGGAQVTGKEIAYAVKQSKGKYTFETYLQKLLDLAKAKQGGVTK